jgi:LacI family transcriptional regulator
MPDPAIDPFWETAQSGVEEAKKAFAPFGLHIQIFFFNPDRKKTFHSACDKSRISEPDGILIAPFFQKESAAFIRSMEISGIPSITFNALLKETETKSFIGQDLYQTGRLAAHLMASEMQSPAEILIVHIEEDVQNSIHLKEKERGFIAYFQDKYGDRFTVKRLELKSGKRNSLKNTFFQTLRKNPGINGLFVTTSKTYRIAGWLEESKQTGMVLVGYDLLSKNLFYLGKGIIRFLINQHPGLQTYLGLAYFTDLLIFKKEIPRQRFLPIDIVTSENINYYKTGLDLSKDQYFETNPIKNNVSSE